MGFLASDAMNGRGSGTRDEWITATYIAAQLRRLGLEPLGDNGDCVETVEIARNEVVGAPVLSVGSSTWIHGGQMMVVRLTAAGARRPLQKYKANVPVQAGATLLMPEDAEPGAANVAGAGIVLWHETAGKDRGEPRVRNDRQARCEHRAAHSVADGMGSYEPGAATGGTRRADYHQPSDKLERIDFAHMTEAIQSLLAPVRWLADSDFRPDWTAGGKPP
jgi:hypothetical protein